MTFLSDFAKEKLHTICLRLFPTTRTLRRRHTTTPRHDDLCTLYEEPGWLDFTLTLHPISSWTLQICSRGIKEMGQLFVIVPQ